MEELELPPAPINPPISPPIVDENIPPIQNLPPELLQEPSTPLS